MGIGDLMPIAMVLLVAVIAISIGATVLTEIQDTQIANSTAYNITKEGLDSFKTFGDFFPVIVIVAIAAVIIGLVSWFGGSGSRLKE